MTVSEELFYTDAMVRKEYEQLSEEDKKRFDQMKVLAEKIKKETGQYVLFDGESGHTETRSYDTTKCCHCVRVFG